jgi:hypothetical protein
VCKYILKSTIGFVWYFFTNYCSLVLFNSSWIFRRAVIRSKSSCIPVKKPSVRPKYLQSRLRSNPGRCRAGTSELYYQRRSQLRRYQRFRSPRFLCRLRRFCLAVTEVTYDTTYCKWRTDALYGRPRRYRWRCQTLRLYFRTKGYSLPHYFADVLG